MKNKYRFYQLLGNKLKVDNNLNLPTINYFSDVIESKAAFYKFKELVARQGGDISYLENPDRFEKAPIIMPVIMEVNQA